MICVAKTRYIWKNNWNLGIEEFKDNQLYLVAEHNDLITKARHDLTSQQLKIVDFIIAKIKPDDEHFNVIDTSMNELANVLKLTPSSRVYSQLIDNVHKLRQKEVTVYNEDEKAVTITGWLENAKICESGKIKLKINKNFTPYLLQLKGSYTQYYLYDTVRLSSKYAIQMYKLMREADKTHGKKMPIAQGSPEDWKKWMGAPESYNYNRLKENVLKKAIEEVNEIIVDMHLKLYQAKRGRKVTQVEVHNEISAN